MFCRRTSALGAGLFAACLVTGAAHATITPWFSDLLRDGEPAGRIEFTIDESDPRFGQPMSAVGDTIPYFLPLEISLTVFPGFAPENATVNAGLTYDIGDNAFGDIFGFRPDALPDFPASSLIEFFDLAAGDGIFTWTFGSGGFNPDTVFLNGMSWGFVDIEGGESSTVFLDMTPPAIVPTPGALALASLALLSLGIGRRRCGGLA
ncbi:MAG: hypothetical protein EA376_03345 [Phycisphaeraceae bacterium]|nr:MAG: hypothetical protein EA376_03345 [Phycisphaeraceae bacterium]